MSTRIKKGKRTRPHNCGRNCPRHQYLFGTDAEQRRLMNRLMRERPESGEIGNNGLPRTA